MKNMCLFFRNFESSIYFSITSVFAEKKIMLLLAGTEHWAWFEKYRGCENDKWNLEWFRNCFFHLFRSGSKVFFVRSFGFNFIWMICYLLLPLLKFTQKVSLMQFFGGPKKRLGKKYSNSKQIQSLKTTSKLHFFLTELISVLALRIILRIFLNAN